MELQDCRVVLCFESELIDRLDIGGFRFFHFRQSAGLQQSLSGFFGVFTLGANRSSYRSCESRNQNCRSSSLPSERKMGPTL